MKDSDIHNLIRDTETRLEGRLEKSHMAVAKILSDNGAELKHISAVLTAHNARETQDRSDFLEHVTKSNEVFEKIGALTSDDIIALKAIATGWDFASTLKKFIIGTGSIAAAIWGIITVVRTLK